MIAKFKARQAHLTASVAYERGKSAWYEGIQRSANSVRMHYNMTLLETFNSLKNTLNYEDNEKKHHLE